PVVHVASGCCIKEVEISFGYAETRQVIFGTLKNAFFIRGNTTDITLLPCNRLSPWIKKANNSCTNTLTMPHLLVLNHRASRYGLTISNLTSATTLPTCMVPWWA